MEHTAIQMALECIATGNTRREMIHLTRDLGMCCGGQVEIYVEPIQKKQTAIVFGAGHIAQATAPLLHALDFHVTIVDERDEFASVDRFPNANLHQGCPLTYAQQVTDSENTFLLVTTHEHRLDQDLVEVLLPKHFAWLGLIGSRAKVAKFLIRYRAAGLDEALFRKLSAPVGLSLGAQTPSEIAISIAAEVVRVRRKHRDTPVSLSEIALPARGHDGKACPPGLAIDEVLESD